MFDFHNKSIVVLGLARSGTSIAKTLHRLGAHVVVNDAKEEEKCPEKGQLEALGIKVICGGHPLEIIHENIDMIVKNPGIPYRIELIQRALDLKIPIVTEVELAYQFSKAPIIGITGSNGKTTSTTLIGEILKEANKSPVVAGNIGTVLSEKALAIDEEQVLVAELSSFQLKGTIHFRPHIAILLNIYPAHIDYHQTIEDYIQSKANIFIHQTEKDYAILNAECEKCTELMKWIKSNVYLFSTKKPVERGAYIENGSIYIRDDNHTMEVVKTNQLFLKGAHLENALAASLASYLYGAKIEDVKKILVDFKGVEHRLEYVIKTEAGIIYYNDSKSTNTQATISALTSFEKPVILIAGGLDRGIDFLELVEPFKKHVKALVTYGQTAQKLKNIGEKAGLQLTFTVDNVNEAVKKATALAEREDIVLLSPACASWDMFSTFEERGRIFKEAVHKLN